MYLFNHSEGILLTPFPFHLPLILGTGTCLLRLGKTDGVSTEIVDRVVLSEESVTDNPKRTDRSGNIHSGE